MGSQRTNCLNFMAKLWVSKLGWRTRLPRLERGTSSSSRSPERGAVGSEEPKRVERKDNRVDYCRRERRKRSCQNWKLVLGETMSPYAVRDSPPGPDVAGPSFNFQPWRSMLFHVALPGSSTVISSFRPCFHPS